MSGVQINWKGLHLVSKGRRADLVIERAVTTRKYRVEEPVISGGYYDMTREYQQMLHRQLRDELDREQIRLQRLTPQQLHRQQYEQAFHQQMQQGNFRSALRTWYHSQDSNA